MVSARTCPVATMLLIVAAPVTVTLLIVTAPVAVRAVIVTRPVVLFIVNGRSAFQPPNGSPVAVNRNTVVVPSLRIRNEGVVPDTARNCEYVSSSPAYRLPVVLRIVPVNVRFAFAPK